MKVLVSGTARGVDLFVTTIPMKRILTLPKDLLSNLASPLPISDMLVAN